MFWNRTAKADKTKGGRAQSPKGKGKDPDITPGGFVDIWGEHIHSARYYRSFTVFLAFVITILGFAFSVVVTRPDPLPIVVRVDQVGRAQVVDYNAGRATAAPDDPVIPYFLTQFVYDHYSRRRVIGTEDWRRSLFFLRQDVARQVVDRDRQSFVDFLSDDGAPERLVEDLQIRLVPQPEPPYAAELLFDLVEQIYGGEVSRSSLIVSVRFMFAEEISGSSVLINPLGLVIIYLDQQIMIGGSQP